LSPSLNIQPLAGKEYTARLSLLEFIVSHILTFFQICIYTLLFLAGCSPPPAERAPAEPAPSDSASLVLTGGKIVTVDSDIGTVEAIAIREHRILAVGTSDEIAAHTTADTRVIDLDGRLVVPGFIEGHGHYMSYGRAQQILDLGSAASWSDITAMVATAVDRADPGEWIYGRGWHQEKWTAVPQPNVDGVPLNDDLNQIAPDNPVLLGHASGHAVFVNDAALNAAGIHNQTPDPDGGTIVRTSGGRATGLLRESAQRLAASAAARYEARRPASETEALLREQVALAGKAALRYGVTSFHDAGSPFATIDFLKTMEAQGSLPIRLYVMINGASVAEMDTQLPDYLSLAEDNDFLVVRSIKGQIDGALGSHGAWLLEPYSDLPTTSGLVLMPVDTLRQTADLAIAHGFQLSTHAIGTRGNRETLDVYEQAFAETDEVIRDHRWRVEHAQHIHPDDIPRFGSLGVIAAIQGIHCTSDGPWISTRLGVNRTRLTSYRWRDLLDSGAMLNNGTDVPVEAIDPIKSFYSSVARVMINGEAFYSEQAMTRMEALHSYTMANAYSAFEEADKGSLTPGKLADLAVLSADILTIPEEEIPDAVVDYTIIGGNIAYQRIGD
jgi:predicted amidohydrolase YtcJ